MSEIFITLNNFDEFDNPFWPKPGEVLRLKKDPTNCYDDEAIVAYREQSKIAYVANSVDTVARGTYSSGRLYDHIKDEQKIQVMFVLDEFAIAKVMVEK